MVYGLDYKVERYDEGVWSTDPITPVGFPRVGFVMGGGSASQCQSLEIPASMLPGQYRLRKRADAGGRNNRELTAGFRVVG